MVTILSDAQPNRGFDRYREQWEASLLASVIAGMADLSVADRKEALRGIYLGGFNGAAFGVYDGDELSGGALEWTQAGPQQFDLVYSGRSGIHCNLGRVYAQPNGSWAALVIAGVKDDLSAAMASAEWAIARLGS